MFQAITNVYDFGMTPLQSAGATRFHHQLLPPDLIVFSPLVPWPEETISALGDQGYRAKPAPYSFGDLQIILRRPDDVQAGSDPRKRGESRVLHVAP